MCDAPSCNFFALIAPDGRSDFPQHLLVDAAHRRAQRRRCVWRVEIKDAHKIFALKVVARLQSAAAHQAVADAGLRGIPKGCPGVEFIIVFQKGICKCVENIPFIFFPIFPHELRSDHFQLRAKVGVRRNRIAGFQHGGHCGKVFVAELPEIYAARIFPCAGV
ncbi:MAG: hypothetical protein Q4A88_08605 [Clostridia bacterium]|nr:hypothetical protein [Clostridia bacterium]